MQRRSGRRHMTDPPDNPKSRPLPPIVGYLNAVEGRDTAKPAARAPRRPTLKSVAKQASAADIPIARLEIKPDSTIVVVPGKPEPAAPADPWPLDEFRPKEPKP